MDALNTVDQAYRTELYRVNEANFTRYDARLEQRLAEFEVKMETRIARLEGRMLRWMFTFWTGQLIALAGLLFLILRR